MATATASVTSAPLPAAEPVRPRTVLVGTALACMGIAMYFVGVLSIYAAQRQQTLKAGNEWIPHLTIELTPGVFMWFTALMSLVTMAWAVWSTKRDDKRHALMALGITALFGFAMVNQTVFYLNDMAFPIDTSVASLLLYVAVGSHMALMIGAVIFVGIMAFRSLTGQYSSHNADGIIAAAMVWLLMVGVYSAIWYIIYVTK
ncbi:MAG: hypothetical protein HKN26_00620 [Acidimicrobiales bacterium]|nr:hypothetical protein [Acidimicrobiales bacterium]